MLTHQYWLISISVLKSMYLYIDTLKNTL